MIDLSIQLLRLSDAAGSASETVASKDGDGRFGQALAAALEGQSAAAGANLSPAQVESLRLQMLLSMLTLLAPSPLESEDESGAAGQGSQDWLMSLARAWPQAQSARTASSVGADLTPPPWPSHLSALSEDISAPNPSASRPKGQKFDGLIEKSAQTFGLDPNLVRAVIRAESDFDPGSVSRAGAQGLMQLMPETARDLGVGNALDPVQNIYGGCRYLRQMLDRYGGDLDQALAAYNWGPGRMDRSPATLPEETRLYIQRVRRFHQQFTQASRA